jgi:hypothetical protein
MKGEKGDRGLPGLPGQKGDRVSIYSNKINLFFSTYYFFLINRDDPVNPECPV